MRNRVGHPGKQRLQWRRAANTYYHARAAAFASNGLTSRGTSRIYLIGRDELAGIHGKSRKAEYQRLQAAALKAQGLTTRGTLPVRKPSLSDKELAWRDIKAQMEPTTGKE